VQLRSYADLKDMRREGCGEHRQAAGAIAEAVADSGLHLSPGRSHVPVVVTGTEGRHSIEVEYPLERYFARDGKNPSGPSAHSNPSPSRR
jgi:hypothetical protein